MSVDENKPAKTKKELYDEQRAIRLKEREKEAQKALKQAKKDEKKNTYHNPVYSTPGKILIWLLCILMLAGIVIGLVFTIINNLK